MGFRLTHRPGFSVRRFLHNLREDFRVWRLNRDVADAFHDPLLDGPRLSDRLRALPGRLMERARAGSLPRLPRAKGLAPVSPLARFPVKRRYAILVPAAALAGAGAWYAARHASPPAPADIIAEGTVAPEVPFTERATALETRAPGAPATDAQASGAPTLGAPATGAPIPEAPGDSKAASLAPAVPGTEPEPVPARLPERYYALIASKRERILHVYERQGTGRWRKETTFPMAYGRWAGDKSDAGDRRTPEGRYWITATLSGPRQGPLYGPLVFTLNYPSPKDIAEGKSGEGIWIHGVPAGQRPTFTRGCLSLSNDDVFALADYAGLGTPVVILSDSALPDPARQLDETGMQREYPALITEYGGRPGSDSARRENALAEARAFLAKEAKDFPPDSRAAVAEADRQAILARLDRWRGDWSRRDTAAYEGNYSPDFRDRMGRSRADFMERKRRIFATKRRITMELQGPEIKAEGYGRVSVTFRQEYEAEGAAPGEGVQRSSGPKTIWLEQGSDGWYIVKE